MLGTAAAVLYTISATLILIPILRGSSIKKKGFTLLLASTGTLLHAWLLLITIIDGSNFNLNLINALSLISWLMTFIVVSLSLKRPTESLGIVILPVTALTTLTAAFTSTSANTISPEIQTHIFLSVIAYGVLGIAAIQAIIASVLSQQLHQHKPGGFAKALPPLRVMENTLQMLLSAGFTLLTLSLASGFLYLDDMFAQHLVHKTVLSLAAWTVFAILLFGHWRYGWRGKTALKWTLSAYGLLLLSYFGSKFVLEVLIH